MVEGYGLTLIATVITLAVNFGLSLVIITLT